MKEIYTKFAYNRFSGKRKYIWGRYSKFYKKKISFKNKVVLDYGCGNIETTVSTKQFFDENGNLNNFYGYETDKLSKEILLKKKMFYDFYEDDSLKNKLDYIVANQVYEHLDREERINFIKRSQELLKKDGFLVLAFPFNLYNMNFKYFWEDITHKPVGVETEASLIDTFGFSSELFVCGLKGDPFGIIENIICLIRNLILLFPPFWITLIISKKIK